MLVVRSLMQISEDTKCLHRCVDMINGLTKLSTVFVPQNLQQSRSFGNNFKFPESSGDGTGVGTAAASGGNATFGDDGGDDDLYA